MPPKEPSILSSVPIGSARELWSAIVERAGLDAKRYDGPLLEELARLLELPNADDFEETLDRGAVSVERLLTAFLTAVAPYAAMMQDIFEFFSRAQARYSESNLAVRFNRDEGGAAFELNLENFREWARHLQTAVSVVEVPEVSRFQAHELRYAFVVEDVTYRIEGQSWVEITPEDDRVRTWLDNSDRTAGAISTLPPPPPAAGAELPALLRRVWDVLRASPSTELFAADDVQTIVRGAYLLAPNDVDLAHRLRKFFERVSVRRMEVEDLLESLEEVLNLPAWELRSEVYSVWVGTQLIGALGPTARVH